MQWIWRALVVASLAVGTTTACSSIAETPSSTGQALVDEICAACHSASQVDSLVARYFREPDSTQELDSFLQTHHVDDPNKRAQIIAYLASRLPARVEGD